ncbi:E3 ubiquitin-protein ligase rnf168 isoform X1 [Anguilla anguilla]|uniref:E3 ubiquitin-protein ligase rnf168 isoform X1 n=1 Tax=Anguilla anguilla TaxID=7936 RepID=UPI0015B2DAB1|nr:E3 ubiquitin-protein ligase rnf168 isoform X1 [Anguilla anguilla]
MAPVSETEVDVGEGGSAGGLSQADCTCPVCLEIFLEPVTLPCSHTFCKPCFLETVDKANLCCPLCRRRVSTWARLHSRNKTLVNVELWRRLQEAFPAQCQRRLSGQDAEDMATVACRPRVSLPGEVRQEYEDQITKLAEEKRALEEAERRASEEYIQRLLAEEEERRAEERRALEERQLEEDERLARLLSQELNSTPMSESQRNARPSESTSTKKKSSAGDIERFLLPLPLRSPTSAETSPGSSLTANKENILMLPSSVVPEEMPMPTLDFYGKEASARSQPEGTEPLPPDACCAQLEQDADGRGSSVSQTRGGASGKRKCGDADAGRGCGLDSKRPRGPASGPAEAPLVWEEAREEEDLFSRRQQEESDRQLALRLQKQLDREEAQRAVDRSKGSPDQYPLRDKPEPGTAPDPAPGPAPSAATDASPAVRASRGRSSAAVTPKEQKNRARRQLAGTPKERQATRKDTSASTSDSAPSSTSSALQKGGKQTTLTAMFPSLAS